MGNVFEHAHRVLRATEPQEKCRLAFELSKDWETGILVYETNSLESVMNITAAGRPERPVLTRPRGVARRSLHTSEGRKAFMHAIAHIEFNAINLACDAVHRFRGMPRDYYGDWIGVAADEARHFTLLQDYLHKLGCRYGDFPAHGGLWDMAERTAHDVLARMALVPRVLEARGLDVTPAMIERLQAACDIEGAEILRIIYQEEIRHVAAGSRWFRYLCAQRGLEPRATFRELVERHFTGELRGPFNMEARIMAGFDAEELEGFAG
ncbi:MAG TPA: ferritin-like domain-containing protein [Gammaproteobacteria bacterium]|nr:ferritin-like domain-containing protein [Gammaproteobacteria bacterium]